MPVSRWLTGTSRLPCGPARITVASSAASTGSASPVGAAVTMLPPSVPGVADLRRSGRAGGGGQRRDERGEVRAAHAGVGQSGAEQRVAVGVLPAADLADASESDQSRGAQKAGVDRCHQVGAAGDRHGCGHGGQRRDRLVERGGQRHRASRLPCVRAHAAAPSTASAGRRRPSRPHRSRRRTVRADSPVTATLAHVPSRSTRGSVKGCCTPDDTDRPDNRPTDPFSCFAALVACCDVSLRSNGARPGRPPAGQSGTPHTIGGVPSIGRPITPGRRCHGCGPPGGRYSTPRASSRL